MARNQNIFCDRKGGATIDGKFYPAHSVSTFLAAQIKRKTDEQFRRNARRKARQEARERAFARRNKDRVVYAQKTGAAKKSVPGILKRMKNFFRNKQ